MERLTEWNEWKEWTREDWDLLPLVIRCRPDRPGLPASWMPFWEEASPHAALLESGKDGRYTYAALRPAAMLEGKGLSGQETLPGEDRPLPEGGRARLEGAAAAERKATLEGQVAKPLSGRPLELLRQWMGSCRAPRPGRADLPPFLGGAVGYLAYDVARSLERLPATAADDPGFADYVWLRFDEVWIYDHAEDWLYCAVHEPARDDARLAAAPPGEASSAAASSAAPSASPGAAAPSPAPQPAAAPSAGPASAAQRYARAVRRAEAMAERWRRWMAAAAPLHPDAAAFAASVPDTGGVWPGARTAFPAERFQQAVRDIQAYIAAGDVFQVNVSLRQEAPLASSPEEVYEWLRLLNPSPYMGLLRTPGFALASASPELLVKRRGDRVSARPIAGTRRRGRTPAEDAAMEAELRGSDKEVAEHIMLVDLERNDIGRIAAYGSVSVPELMTVERYSHVMHLVSQVEGRVAEGKDSYEIIAAMFPGGTITGAPKVRTMEIIEELEPVRRGPYTGAMGWIDYGGDMELNMIIRTLAVKDGIGYVQTGAGIVIDSDPYREYRECHNKAKAVVKAIQCSEAARERRTSGGA